MHGERDFEITAHEEELFCCNQERERERESIYYSMEERGTLEFLAAAPPLVVRNIGLHHHHRRYQFVNSPDGKRPRDTKLNVQSGRTGEQGGVAICPQRQCKT